MPKRTYKERPKHRNTWSRDPQEQVHGDTRLKRQRSRADAEREALEDAIAEIDEALEESEIL